MMRTGRITSAYWQLADRSKHSTNTYQYNHRGQLVSRVPRVFGQRSRRSRCTPTMTKGNRTAERFCRSDRVRGTAAYFYDASGQTGAGGVSASQGVARRRGGVPV